MTQEELRKNIQKVLSSDSIDAEDFMSLTQQYTLEAVNRVIGEDEKLLEDQDGGQGYWKLENEKIEFRNRAKDRLRAIAKEK